MTDKIKCIIVDDEEGAHRVLLNYIAKVEELELSGAFLNALEAFQFLKKTKVDILFLDINMPEINGFTLLKMLKNPPKVIITSAYSEYAVESFDFDVTDYLLKPIRLERFIKSFEKAKAQLDSTVKIKPTIDFIEIKFEGELKKFALNDILYFQSVGNYNKIVAVSKNYIVHVTTKTLEQMLVNTDFIRIHKSFIVNKHFLEAIEKETVIVKGRHLPIGKTFKKYLEVFLQ